jgi:predicted phosphodiesterase
MMKIGVISDLHGCLEGLAATLKWLQSTGVDLIVCAGDVAAFGPQPNECIALLAEWEIPTIQGNTDIDMIHPPPFTPPTSLREAELAAIADWSRGELTPQSRDWLAGLPPRLYPAPDVLIVHGGLEDAKEIITMKTPPVLPPGISVVAAGHLHTPFIIHTQKGMWVNAGSAGHPKDGDTRASLAILKGKPGKWEAAIHRVPFDLQSAARAIHRMNMPYAEKLAQSQQRGCWW